MYGHSAPKLKAFAKGVVKAVLYGVGFFTEIIGREEYGSRIKNPNPARDFPIIQDKSYKELAAEMLVAPAQLVLDIKKDPTNPELWGQAALMIGILKFDFGIKGRAPDIALGLNEPVKAGPPRSLIRFSEEQNAYMHYDWNKPFGSLAKQSPTDVSFGDLFDRVIEHVAQNKGTIKFDITNLDFGRVKADLGQNALNSASLTNYEFNTIMNNKSYLKSTKFYENGKLQNTKEVVDRYQKAHPTTSSSN